MRDESIAILVKSFGLETSGLAQAGFCDLRAACKPANYHAATVYLNDLVRYILSGHPIGAGETAACGSWLIRFDDDDGFLRAKEAHPESDEYRDGVDRAVSYFESQQDLCIQHGAAFSPIAFMDWVLASKDVFEAESAVDGYRYPIKELGDSPLCLLGPSYGGDHRNLKRYHAYHVMMARPDLIAYFGLPPGYCFSSSGNVWFDQDVGDGK